MIQKISSGDGGASFSMGVIIGIAIGCTILVLGLVAVGIYAVRQKKRAERAIELSKPFGNYISNHHSYYHLSCMCKTCRGSNLYTPPPFMFQLLGLQVGKIVVVLHN